jgi:hypothetical protein
MFNLDKNVPIEKKKMTKAYCPIHKIHILDNLLYIILDDLLSKLFIKNI